MNILFPHCGSAATGEGLGLLGMKERVLLIGGKIEICSMPGLGTRVGIRIPLQIAEADAMHKKKVLIADDHALVREGIAAFLKLCDDVEVVAEASDGLEALEKAAKFRPDIVIMDINMPKLGGLETTVEMKKLHPNIEGAGTDPVRGPGVHRAVPQGRRLGLSAEEGGGQRSDSCAPGRGPGRTLPLFVGRIGGRGRISARPDRKDECEDPYEKLSDREKQVLKLVAEGYTHKEVADMLNISVKTVIAHQTNIGEKLGIHATGRLDQICDPERDHQDRWIERQGAGKKKSPPRRA